MLSKKITAKYLIYYSSNKVVRIEHSIIHYTHKITIILTFS